MTSVELGCDRTICRQSTRIPLGPIAVSVGFVHFLLRRTIYRTLISMLIKVVRWDIDKRSEGDSLNTMFYCTRQHHYFARILPDFRHLYSAP